MANMSALSGRLDCLTHAWISGWVIDPDSPGSAVPLELVVDQEPAGEFLADRYRHDLANAGLGGGRCAFEVRLPHGMSPLRHHDVILRHARDGRKLARARLSRVTTFPRVAPYLDNLFASLAHAASKPAQLDPLIGLLDRFALNATMVDLPTPAAQPDLRARALFIDHAIPVAARDGGSTVAVSHVQALERLGYRVAVLATAPRPPALFLPENDTPAWDCANGDIEWQGPPEAVLQRQRGAFAVIYVHRLANMRAHGKAARAANPTAHVLFSVADLESRRVAGQMSLNASDLHAAHALSDLERETAASADTVVTHAPVEAALLRAQIATPVHVVRWAVARQPAAPGFSQRSGVAFIGSYGHAPNLDAAEWLIGTIMPLVWQQNRALPCLLVGSDPPQCLHEWVDSADAPAGMLAVLGHVPDLAAVWSRVRLSVAPLRFGAGVKVKVVESLAAGIPCVCTPVAAEGLESGLPFQMVAAEPQAVADAILRLHASAVANAAASDAGQRWVRAAFSTEALDRALGAALGRHVTAAADAPAPGQP